MRGEQEGVPQIANLIIVAPSGEIVGAGSTTGDELAVVRYNLTLTRSYKNATLNFAQHREPQAYGLMVERKGVVPPPG